MRMIVICLTMGTLLWQTSLENPPNLLTLIGFVTVCGLTLTQLFRRVGLPGLLGALLAGFLLGETRIISSEYMENSHHIYDFALAWTGLYLSAGITPKILTNLRLCLGSLCLYFPPVVMTLGYLLFQSIPMLTALPLALLAGTSVILFLPPNSKMRGEILPLSKLTTLIGLLLWMAFSLDTQSIFGAKPLVGILLDISIFIVALEATVQICRIAKTEIAQHLAFLVLAYLLAIASFDREISSFFLAFPAGVFLSFRHAHHPLLHGRSLSDALLSFVLASFAIKTFLAGPSIIAYDQVTLLSFYLITLVAGKTIGGILAHHFFDFPTKTWLPLIPQGLVAFLCLAYQPTSFFAFQGALHITVLLAFMTMSFVYPICAIIWAQIKKDPLASL
jgi:hypothetical protein